MSLKFNEEGTKSEINMKEMLSLAPKLDIYDTRRYF